VPPASALPDPDARGPHNPAAADAGSPDQRDRASEHDQSEFDRMRVERFVERSPLEAAEDAFGWLVTGPAPLSLRGIDRPSLPRRAVPLHHLRTRLAAGRIGPRDRDAIWAALVYRARTAPSPAGRARWTLGCVGVALPLLVPMAARLSVRYPGDPADLEAAILAAFLAELRRVDICTPDLATRLTGAAERAAAALAVALYAHDHTGPHDSETGDTSRDGGRPGDPEARVGRSRTTAPTAAPTPTSIPASTSVSSGRARPRARGRRRLR
jgi:hypothetical protein